MYNVWAGEVMVINLGKILSGREDIILLDNNINFDDDYFTTSFILNLEQSRIIGEVRIDNDDSIILDIECFGIMTIEDSITLEPVNYKFSCKIHENLDEMLEKSQNSLDITDILWQNIVLEVPIKYTEVKDFSKFKGDGWKVINEDELVTENPFKILSEKIEQE